MWLTMQRTITVEVAGNELTRAHKTVLQAGFKIEEYLHLVVKAAASIPSVREDIVERIFHLLPDNTVLNLAHARIAEKDSKRFSRLLEKQNEGRLTTKERQQLAEMVETYERSTLRKAYVMAEAVRRGLTAAIQS